MEKTEKLEKDYKTDVYDYLRWRGDLTFDQDPFNEVDSLVLCIISYINFQRFTALQTREPKEAVALEAVARQLTEADEQLGLSALSYLPVMRLAAQTRRFGRTRMFAYEHRADGEKEMQFDAVSFLLADNSVFVAFMGTDRSIAGWKEDFIMSFLSATPSQLRATEYAVEIARRCPGRSLRIGGHSKGGNLAAWAAIHLPERLQKSRLDMAYNNDGPGFNRDMVDTPEYRRVAHKLKTFIPEESIVGVLLEHSEDYYVIASNNRGILQHESLSWQTMANHFVYLDARSGMGKMSDELVRQWVNSMTPEEREKFCDAFFDVLSMEGKVSSLDQLEKEGLAGKAALLKQFIGADEEKRRILTDMFRRLAADAGEEVKKSVGGGRKWAAETMQSWKGKVYKITKKR